MGVWNGSSPLARGTRGFVLKTVDPVGSSPLARGTPCFLECGYGSQRFIPACAGNSGTKLRCFVMFSVHPRLRGELQAGYESHNAVIGSSPLARGTPGRSNRDSRQCRFIPACAGNSFLSPLSGLTISVHPRLRGELFYVGTAAKNNFGSSPLARGTPVTFERVPSRWRFIPACAGNSQIGVTKTGFPTVHPRLRGELIYPSYFSIIQFGSSPLARGTRLGGYDGELSDRFIPACAGNSLKMVTTLH